MLARLRRIALVEEGGSGHYEAEHHSDNNHPDDHSCEFLVLHSDIRFGNRGNGRRMARLKSRLWKRMVGGSTAREAGRQRTLRGLREGDNQELYLGLALSALSYLQRTKPRKELIYRKEVPEGSALVIHHKKSGTPRLEIVRPTRRRRS